MKIVLRQITVLFAFLSMPFLMWGQCASCPTSASNCLSPFCCIATGGTNTVDNCIANGAFTIRVNYNNAQVSSGSDASGIHFCLPAGLDLNFAPDVTVDNNTCFTPSSAGNRIFIAGTTLSFSGITSIGELNDEIGAIPDGMTSTIEDIMAALPVELISFTGKASEYGSQLEWITATETDNDYFLLEHSVDAKTFDYLTTIAAEGDGTQEQKYQFLDKDAKSGINYYRLWQYDVDGTKADLGIVEVNNRDLLDSPVTITPNPVVVGGHITLNSSTLLSQPDVTFTLVNSMGQTWSLSPQGNNLLIPSHLSNGLYYLIVTQSSERELLPLVLVE